MCLRPLSVVPISSFSFSHDYKLHVKCTFYYKEVIFNEARSLVARRSEIVTRNIENRLSIFATTVILKLSYQL
jgi:hypothetical protein